MAVSIVEAQARPRLRRWAGNAWLGAGLLLLLGGGLGYGAAQAEYIFNGPPPLSGGNTYVLPVDSRQLTVSLVPLRPGPQVQASLPSDTSKSRAAAATLADTAGMENLRAGLRELYPLGFRTGEAREIPDEYYNFERQQYNADQVLDWLLTQCAPESFRTVGVLEQDIYIPDYNFLFGLAKIGGPACVASCARMSGSLPLARLSPTERWDAIVRHELGHTLGLQHVNDPRSVMHYGNSLQELDQTGTTLTKADWAMLKALHPVKWRQN